MENSFENIRYFGSWKEEPGLTGIAPSVHDFIDDQWRPHDWDKLRKYLNDCEMACVVDAKDVCILCVAKILDQGKPIEFGWMSDGTWLWRSSLPHFMEEHHVRLPQALVDWIRSNNYEAPVKADFDIDKLDWPPPPFKKPGSGNYS